MSAKGIAPKDSIPTLRLEPINPILSHHQTAFSGLSKLHVGTGKLSFSLLFLVAPVDNGQGGMLTQAEEGMKLFEAQQGAAAEAPVFAAKEMLSHVV